MPSISPTIEKTKKEAPAEEKTYSAIPTEMGSEKKTETTPVNRSSFFSFTTVALAVVGAALTVTAYYSAPIAIAATCALGIAGLAYGAVQYFTSPADSTAQTGAQATDTADTNASDEIKPTNSHSNIVKLLPVEENTEEETKGENEAIASQHDETPTVTVTPEEKRDVPASVEPQAQDTNKSESSISMNL
ncbi:MAG: hypothetical protein P1U39_08580 [Legionellaceae bacterium]|nr:hypothetical protein [Legionellaceae bacterium]